MPEIQLFEAWLIAPKDKLITKVSASIRLTRTTAKSTLQSVVAQTTMSSEGIELKDNSVLAPGVISKT